MRPSVATGMSGWRTGLRWVGVVTLAILAQGWVYAALEAGDGTMVFTRFVLIVALYGVARSLVASIVLVLHKRRLRRLPGELDGEDLGAVVDVQRGERSPFPGVIRALHEQFSRNPSAVDSETLIELLRSRLLRAGPVRTLRTAGLTLTLGFLGTCFGLLFTLNGLSAAAAAAGGSSHELTALLFAPGTGPLSQLGGAYLSTLAALAGGSIVLRALAHVQEDGVEDLVDEFTEIVSIYVRPSFHVHEHPLPSLPREARRLNGARA